MQDSTNFDIEKYQKFIEKQSNPQVNFVISMILFFCIPLVFQIVASSYQQLGLIGGIVTFFQMTSSVIGRYGCDNKQRWALTVYKDSSIVLAVLYFLLFILYIIHLSQNQYPAEVVFLVVVITIIFLIMSIWMLISFIMIKKYLQKVDWFYEQKDQEAIINFRKSKNEDLSDKSFSQYGSDQRRSLHEQLLKNE